MLLAHPKVLDDPLRVRFAGFGAYSLDFDIFAYIRTSDWNEFLAIREEIFLRVADIVQEVGTSFAFPSQTHYLARDAGLDATDAATAGTPAEASGAEPALPFPNLAERQRPRAQEPPDAASAATANGPYSGARPEEPADGRRAKDARVAARGRRRGGRPARAG